jgi:hypothetical protein
MKLGDGKSGYGVLDASSPLEIYSDFLKWQDS